MASDKGKPAKVNILKPSMREKKRYMAYEITSERPVKDADRMLMASISGLLGVFEAGKAGLMPVKYNAAKQRGLLRVDRKFVDHVRSCFVMIKSLGGEKVLIRTLFVSGMLNKAGEYIN